MIVVDASAMVLALASSDAHGEAARAALSNDSSWAAPAHMPWDVARTLCRAVRHQQLSEEDAEAVYSGFTDTEILCIGTNSSLMHSVWQLRHNVSAYGAPYLSLAAMYEAPLVTADRRLANASTHTPLPVTVLRV